MTDYVGSKVELFRVSSVMGLGLAYAGTMNDVVTELLTPALDDESLEVAAVAAIALGQVHVGTGNAELAETIVNRLLALDEAKLGTYHARMLALAVGLVFMGTQADAAVRQWQLLWRAVCGCGCQTKGDTNQRQQLFHLCMPRLPLTLF